MACGPASSRLVVGERDGYQLASHETDAAWDRDAVHDQSPYPDRPLTSTVGTARAKKSP